MVNELKLTQFSFFHFKSVAANVSELFCVAVQTNNDAFYTIVTFHFKFQVL